MNYGLCITERQNLVFEMFLFVETVFQKESFLLDVHTITTLQITQRKR